MQAVARHDVGLVAEDARGALLHVHKFEEAELALFVVEKQVNVGIRPLPRRAPSSRTGTDVRRQAVSTRLRAAAIGLWLRRVS